MHTCLGLGMIPLYVALLHFLATVDVLERFLPWKRASLGGLPAGPVTFSMILSSRALSLGIPGPPMKSGVCTCSNTNRQPHGTQAILCGCRRMILWWEPKGETFSLLNHSESCCLLQFRSSIQPRYTASPAVKHHMQDLVTTVSIT